MSSPTYKQRIKKCGSEPYYRSTNRKRKAGARGVEIPTPDRKDPTLPIVKVRAKVAAMSLRQLSILLKKTQREWKRHRAGFRAWKILAASVSPETPPTVEKYPGLSAATSVAEAHNTALKECKRRVTFFDGNKLPFPLSAVDIESESALA